MHVIDAKRYTGRPDLRVDGGLLRPRVEKLVVGRRDCTALVDGVHAQVDVVRQILATTHPHVPVHGVRCFVDAALTVAKDDLAAAATARYEFLDLVQASVVADFSDDPDAVKALVAAAKTCQSDHVAQRLRDTRTERLAREAAADRLRATGVTVIDRPEYGSKTTRLGNLTNTPDTPTIQGVDSGEKPARVALTVETHADCPGHAAYLTETWVRGDHTTPAGTDETDGQSADAQPETDTDYEDTTEDEDATEDEADADDEVDADLADDEDGDGGGDGPDGRWEWVPIYVCTDPTGNGHHALYGKIVESKPTVAEMTDEQRVSPAPSAAT